MCGVFGVFGHKEAARLTYLGLYALQHRGEESAGIASFDGKKLRFHKGMGLVCEVFSEDILKKLKGFIAVGHNRYSTTGSSIFENIQPLTVNHKKTSVVVAHNGNFTNTYALHQELEKEGSIFRTTMDSEILLHLLAKAGKDNFKDNLIYALSKIEGAYSLVMMIGRNLIGARDIFGFRPLCLGKLDDAYILCSESCALDILGATYLRDVEPGEIIIVNEKGIESIKPFSSQNYAYCIFEYIYFARPDSVVFKNMVYMARKKLGEKLAEEAPLNCDFVMPIPDSGNYAALGFAQKLDVPFEMAIVRNHYVGRTFIQPSQLVRDFRVKVKLNPVREVLKDKSVAIIEDSIVRGTTSRIRVRTLREAGAREVHMRVSCPPIKFPCFYGIDFPTKRELIAFSKTVEEIRDFIGLDSLIYLSLEGLLESMPEGLNKKFCTACFTGNYPVKVKKRLSKHILER